LKALWRPPWSKPALVRRWFLLEPDLAVSAVVESGWHLDCSRRASVPCTSLAARLLASCAAQAKNGIATFIFNGELLFLMTKIANCSSTCNERLRWNRFCLVYDLVGIL
jgi:hypothetical protein